MTCLKWYNVFGTYCCHSFVLKVGLEIDREKHLSIHNSLNPHQRWLCTMDQKILKSNSELRFQKCIQGWLLQSGKDIKSSGKFTIICYLFIRQRFGLFRDRIIISQCFFFQPKSFRMWGRIFFYYLNDRKSSKFNN